MMLTSVRVVSHKTETSSKMLKLAMEMRGNAVGCSFFVG